MSTKCYRLNAKELSVLFRHLGKTIQFGSGPSQLQVDFPIRNEKTSLERIQNALEPQYSSVGRPTAKFH